jgi:hypothetical protein
MLNMRNNRYANLHKLGFFLIFGGIQHNSKETGWKKRLLS